MNKKQLHYYLYNGNRYENMKQCCKAIGNGINSKSFKHLRRMRIVKKIYINSDAQIGTKTSEHDKEKTEAGLYN